MVYWSVGEMSFTLGKIFWFCFWSYEIMAALMVYVIRRSIYIPLWNPYIMSGTPLLAQPGFIQFSEMYVLFPLLIPILYHHFTDDNNDPAVYEQNMMKI